MQWDGGSTWTMVAAQPTPDGDFMAELVGPPESGSGGGIHTVRSIRWQTVGVSSSAPFDDQLTISSTEELLPGEFWYEGGHLLPLLLRHADVAWSGDPSVHLVQPGGIGNPAQPFLTIDVPAESVFGPGFTEFTEYDGTRMMIPRSTATPLFATSYFKIVATTAKFTATRTLEERILHDSASDESTDLMGPTYANTTVGMGHDGEPLFLAHQGGLLGKVDTSNITTQVLLSPTTSVSYETLLAGGESATGELAALIWTAGDTLALIRWDTTTSTTTPLASATASTLPATGQLTGLEPMAICQPLADGSWLVGYLGSLHRVSGTTVVSWDLKTDLDLRAPHEWAADLSHPDEPMFAFVSGTDVAAVRWEDGAWFGLHLAYGTDAVRSIRRVAIGRTSDGTPTVCFREHRDEYDGDVYQVVFEGTPTASNVTSWMSW